jgi:hypothetical protein
MSYDSYLYANNPYEKGYTDKEEEFMLESMFDTVLDYYSTNEQALKDQLEDEYLEDNMNNLYYLSMMESYNRLEWDFDMYGGKIKPQYKKHNV